MNLDLAKLKDKLLTKGMPETEINKFLAYVSGAIRDEVKLAQKGKNTPVTNNTEDMLYTMAFKYFNLGLTIDGVNVVITGKNMAMVTFHGYKNRVLEVYPETMFDYGLIREGDEFKVHKESGRVEYTHNINDPFSSDPIKGAYVIFKNKRGEYFEALNTKDFENMKKGSKQSYLWNEWDSEFWLKSVMKRACKRNFNDIVAEIDKNDNDDYGIADPDAAAQGEYEQALSKIASAKNEDELTDVVTNLPSQVQSMITEIASSKFKALTELANDTPKV